MEGGREGLPDRRLPARAGRAVQLVLVPAVVPGVRRRPRSWPPPRRSSPTRPARAARRGRCGVSDQTLPLDADGVAMVPGQGHLGPQVDAFDRRVDELLEHLRGHPLADFVFTNTTHVADFSMIWHGIGIVRGIAKGRPDQVIVPLPCWAPRACSSTRASNGSSGVSARRRPATTDSRCVAPRPRHSRRAIRVQPSSPQWSCPAGTVRG